MQMIPLSTKLHLRSHCMKGALFIPAAFPSVGSTSFRAASVFAFEKYMFYYPINRTGQNRTANVSRMPLVILLRGLPREYIRPTKLRYPTTLITHPFSPPAHPTPNRTTAQSRQTHAAATAPSHMLTPS